MPTFEISSKSCGEDIRAGPVPPTNSDDELQNLVNNLREGMKAVGSNWAFKIKYTSAPSQDPRPDPSHSRSCGIVVTMTFSATET